MQIMGGGGRDTCRAASVPTVFYGDQSSRLLFASPLKATNLPALPGIYFTTITMAANLARWVEDAFLIAGLIQSKLLHQDPSPQPLQCPGGCRGISWSSARGAQRQSLGRIWRIIHPRSLRVHYRGINPSWQGNWRSTPHQHKPSCKVPC